MASGMAVPEIWDEILDHVHVGNDLKAMALVSRAFVFGAQMRLFRFIRVRTAAEAYCLATMQELFPHLLLHIRDLKIVRSNPETLGPIAQIPLLHLHSISFGYMSCAAGEGEKLLNLLSILAALPTIRRLSFQDFGFASFWPELSLLSTLLASCNPAVCSIGFFKSWLPSSSSPASVASYPRRLCITSLRMDRSDYPVDVLDLSGLTHALVCCNPNNNNTGLKALLHNSKNTLTHLDLSGSDRIFEDLDLTCFPNLLCLTLSHIEDFLPRAFQDSTLCNLRVIRYHVSWDERRTTALSTLDLAISQAAIPALQRVEVRLLRTPDDYSPTTFRQDDWALEVKALVPHLVERRILIIESELYV